MDNCDMIRYSEVAHGFNLCIVKCTQLTGINTTKLLEFMEGELGIKIAIDKIAGGGCSNLSENFWGINTNFSEGKRQHFDHTDANVLCNKLTFCRIGVGNIEKTHNDVSARLGLRVTSPDVAYLSSAGKKRAKTKLRQTSDLAFCSLWMWH